MPHPPWVGFNGRFRLCLMSTTGRHATFAKVPLPPTELDEWTLASHRTRSDELGALPIKDGPDEQRDALAPHGV